MPSKRTIRIRPGRAALPLKRQPATGDSPWWRWVAREIASRPGWLGTIRTIEEIVQSLPRYPDGRQVMRGRVAARRLSDALELVSRGPNGSLGIGATYRIVMPPTDVGHELIDEGWLEEAAGRMSGIEQQKGKRWVPPQSTGSLG